MKTHYKIDPVRVTARTEAALGLLLAFAIGCTLAAVLFFSI